MVTRLQHSQIDKIRWDAAVLRSTHPLPYAASRHLDVASPGWDALVLGDYDAVLPLTHRKKYGVRYLYQPFFTQQLGCFAAQPLTVPAAQSFMDALAGQCRFAEIHFNTSCDAFTRTKITGGQWLPRRTHHLALSQPYEGLHQNYHDHTRRALKKALKHGVTVLREPGGDWLATMFAENKRGILRQKDFELLLNIIRTALESNRGSVYAAYENGQRVGGSFMLYNDRFVINLFNVSTERGRHVQAMSALIDFVLRSYADDQQGRVFDFEGSQIESISTFYTGFGAAPVTYWMFRYDALPWPLSQLKRLKDGTQPG